MKKYLHILIGLFPILFYSQQEITGRVVEEDSIPLGFTNVMLLSLPDSVFVKGTTTDEEGTFELKLDKDFNGFLRVSSLGYETREIKVVSGKNNYNFQLPVAMNQLEDVTVSFRQQLFEKRPDRLIVNVQNTVSAAGGTALEILEKSPGVGIDRQNSGISLNGKQGVQVLINGKLSRLPASAVIQMLNGMSSENIENIELITNPPAKYEASGAALININLLENEFSGTNGSYGGHLAYNDDMGYGLNFSLNNRAGKWNSFINYNSSLSQNKNEWYSLNRLNTNGEILINEALLDRHASQFNHNLRLGTSYSLNDRTDLNVLLAGFNNKWKTNDTNRGLIEITRDSTLSFTGDIDEKNHWKHGMVGLGMDHRFSDRSDLTVYVDVLLYDNDQPAIFDIGFLNLQSRNTFKDIIETRKNTEISILVGKVDYSVNLSEKLKLETGAKSSLSEFENDFQVAQSGDVLQGDLEGLSAFLILDEDVYAGYISSEFNPNEKWNFAAGIRYEHTLTELGPPGEALIVDRDYGNIFPNFTANRKIGEDGNLSFSYGRRIARPTFNDLAPFAFFQNPQTLFSGNSNLLPAIIDNLEISFQPAKWWVSLSYSHTKDFIAAFQPELDEETGTQLFRAANLEYLRSYGGQVYLPIKVGDWLDFQNTISLFNIEINPYGNGNEDLFKNLNFGYQGSATFFMPNDLSFEVNANYQSNPSWWGLTDLQPLYRFDLGIKKKLGENGGTLSLVGTDVLNTYKWEWQNPDEAGTDFDFEGYYHLGLQGIRLNYTRNFGNRRLKDVTIDSGSDEEQGRVN
ncbi:outer membrane beta-barrel family protein [Gramella sp. AN32]|uniref:TonB-dependent receptor domain-containing protein n=1 Tax=Christiangramia antarctica TaxID=2058158 RepID=A0ABW5X7D9_9FLAO|nr:outer membrane beta-barrel family protein [Gramella sp. AN32]MCM4155331.1 hypothetical protein [Gramella sp. AN32]